MVWGEGSCRDRRNRLIPFTALVVTLGKKKLIPKALMLSAKIAANVLEGGMAPWELYLAVCNFASGRDMQVQDVIKLAQRWALYAATKGANDKSAVAMALTPITLSSQALKTAMRERLNTMLGKHAPTAPPGPPVQFAPPSRPGRQGGGIAGHAAEDNGPERHRDQLRLPDGHAGRPPRPAGDHVHKYLQEVHSSIELTKNNADLRCVLVRYWAPHQASLNTSIHDIYWTEAMCEAALRKVELTASGIAKFLTAEFGIAILNFLPQTQAVMAEMDCKWWLKALIQGTYTCADAKKEKQVARPPPKDVQGAHLLFTTYALVL